MKKPCSNCGEVATKNLLTNNCHQVPICNTCNSKFESAMYKVAEILANIGNENLYTLHLDLRDATTSLIETSAIQGPNGTFTTLMTDKPDGEYNSGRPKSCLWCQDNFVSADQLSKNKEMTVAEYRYGYIYMETICKKCGKTSQYRQYDVPFSYLKSRG